MISTCNSVNANISSFKLNWIKARNKLIVLIIDFKGEKWSITTGSKPELYFYGRATEQQCRSRGKL